MTCNRDCKDCMYSQKVTWKGLCMTPNQTCNGDCNHCNSYVPIQVSYKCNYPKVTLIKEY